MVFNLKLKISALVVTFNRKDELIKTIKSLRFNGFQECDIFVINNNSNDGTQELIESIFPNLSLINLPENIASAGGFAKGLEISFKKGYDWCFLCNDDSRPKKGCLESMISALNSCSDHKLAFLKVANLNPNGEALLLKWKGIGVQYSIPISDKLIKTDLITFDGCMISSELITKIGYCDPEFFMGVYEYDYCLRAKDAGYSCYVLPNGLLEDGKLGSISGTPPWRQYYNTRNLLWLGINRKSFMIIKGWLIRELKYTYAIIFFGDRKLERLHFKFRAVRDALLNRRGRTYDPSKY
ncbi:glycosyltransferase [Algoriphagus pacificus]|uniref:Glycosyltransferase n=1 Tax=Algoriphagus pacificus TaxID=2811234 RepID=A0ABS3CMV2_9BACT|nr:glycosyltransferase [Algoriphagus pacificus]MBN7817516.1 glycosyltransferase [Algoriphagus pacificus]